MNFQPEQIFTAFAVIVANTITIASLWFRMQNKIERLEEDRSENKRQIIALWGWKDSHEREASDYKDSNNRELAKLGGQNLVVNEQFKQIMNSLSDIKEEFSDIRERLFNLEKR